jgi:hypothetical protein
MPNRFVVLGHALTMTSDDPYRTWANDADTLAKIGRHLFGQPLRVSVRLPRSLANEALAAWQRDDDDDPLPDETQQQEQARHRAGTLGLIGLSIENGGLIQGDEVVVGLDAWNIGTALDTAEQGGTLDGITPPQPGPPMKAAAGDHILTRSALVSEAGCPIPAGSRGIVLDALAGLDHVFEAEFSVVHPGDQEWNESTEIAWVRANVLEVAD